MNRAIAAGLFAGSIAVLAGSGQPAGDHPPIGGHPPVPGHPPITVGAEQNPLADVPKARAEDVATLDAIIGTFYAATAGSARQERDWDRFRSLFIPQARFIAARPGDGTATGAIILSLDDFIGMNTRYFEQGGFFEREIGRRTEAFGNIAHVWSTYESRRSLEDPEPYARGIYSLQLLRDGPRWRIVNVYWDFEREDNPIPDRYRQAPGE